jgi:3-isopropylmalate/(R)-2-methylmalate dehydratase large subunit
MAMTISEKILAKASGKKRVEPGEIVEAKIDVALTHDVLGWPSAEEFKKIGLKKVWSPEKIVVILDHFVPNKDMESAELCRKLREFVKEQGIKNYYEVGRHGICHTMLSEEGFVWPGAVIVGTDSHTCTHGALGAFATGIGTSEMAAVFALGKLWFRVPETMLFNITGNLVKMVSAKDVILKILSIIKVDGAIYKTMEFAGSTVSKMSIEDRMTMCNMTIEAGAKTGIIEPDKRTVDYVRQRTKKKFDVVKNDKGTEYCEILDIDVSDLEPCVACPNLPDNVKPASELDVEIDQAFVGSCTNGRLNDLRIVAKILKGKKVKEGVRMIIIPATQKIYLRALEEGLIKIFIEAGAVVGTPTCGPCLGGHMGVLGQGEVCVASTNRNFKGRMGDITSKVYLASPSTVAASAITGKITDPRTI